MIVIVKRIVYTFIMKALSSLNFRDYRTITLGLVRMIILGLFLYFAIQYLADGRSEKVVVVFVILICILLLFAMVSLYKLLIAMFSRVYIYKDILRDKEVVGHEENGSNTRHFYLYFDGIYGKYRKRTKVCEADYRHAQVGKEYYVGIIHSRQCERVYWTESHELSPAMKKRLLLDIKTLGKCAHWRWRAPENKPIKDGGGVKQITREQILQDMDNYQESDKKGKGIVRYWMSIRNGQYRKRRIMAGRYGVVLEKVEETEVHNEDSFKFREIHKQIPVRLTSGRTIGLSRAAFNDVRPGDVLYVVYLEGGVAYSESDIVAVYQEKLGKLDFGFDVEWAC